MALAAATRTAASCWSGPRASSCVARGQSTRVKLTPGQHRRGQMRPPPRRQHLKPLISGQHRQPLDAFGPRPRRCAGLSTRPSQSASRRRGTTWRPSVRVPPVTRMGDVIAPPDPRVFRQSPAPARASPGARPGGPYRRDACHCSLFSLRACHAPRMSRPRGDGCQCGETRQRENVKDGRQ